MKYLQKKHKVFTKKDIHVTRLSVSAFSASSETSPARKPK